MSKGERYDQMTTNPQSDELGFFENYESNLSYVRNRLMELKPSEIIDLGCGTGNLSGPLSATFSTVGVDQSAEMLSQAQLKYPMMKLNPISLEDWLIQTPIQEGVCIVSSFVFHAIKDKTLLMAELAKRIRAGNRLILLDYVFQDDASRMHFLSELERQQKSELKAIVERKHYLQLDALENWCKNEQFQMTYRMLTHWIACVEIISESQIEMTFATPPDSSTFFQPYIELQNQLALEDPYVIRETLDAFLKQNCEELKSGITQIAIATIEDEAVGYLKFKASNGCARVENVYLKKGHRTLGAYVKMLESLEAMAQKSKLSEVRYVGVMETSGLSETSSLSKAFIQCKYTLEREHIQMEKSLANSKSVPAVDTPTVDMAMATGLTYREFHEIGDAEWIFQWMQTCMVGSSFNYELEEIMGLMSPSTDFAFVLYEQEQPVGFMITRINDKRNQQEQKNVLYIEEIAIHPQYRNKGWGSKAFAVALCEKLAMDHVRLHVFRHNQNAHRLYLKLGFQEMKSIGYWSKSIAADQ